MKKNVLFTFLFVVTIFILMDIKANAAENLTQGPAIEEQYLNVDYYRHNYVNGGYVRDHWTWSTPNVRVALYYGDFTINAHNPSDKNEIIKDTHKGYRLCVLRNEQIGTQYWYGRHEVINYDNNQNPTSNNIYESDYDFQLHHFENVPTSSENFGFGLNGNLETVNLDIDTNIPIFTDWDALCEYLNTGNYSSDDSHKVIDWDNAQLNMTIGFLKNVTLKEKGSKHTDFTITWTADEDLFMSDAWRVQIGFHTRFQKSFFGDRLLHTNLDYVTWDSELYYSSGMWKVNVEDLFETIPDCKYPNYSGNFYLRIIHFDKDAGLVEAGPWGQLSWVIHKGTDEGGRYVSTNYKTIESSNVIEKDGTFDLIEEEYVVDTTSPTSQDYVVNTANGTVDTVSTGLNKIDFGDIDLTDVSNTFINGISSLGDTLKTFPSLIGKVASFLPKEIITLITIGFAFVIVLRIWGR